MDVVTPQRRSEIMSRIRSTDTKPEMVVRKLVHGLGYRYRLHSKDVPGKPDIVFKKRKKVIFVHGCFWHAHEGCSRGNKPKTNVHYWSAKLSGNVERDKRNQTALIAQGWGFLVIWECEIKDLERVAERVINFMER